MATYTNTQGDPTAGGSFSHSPGQPAGSCSRGVGRQNVQTIIMTPSGNIFHVATGFLSSQDLSDEMDFALRLFDSIQLDNDQQARDQLVSAQTERLRRMGFDERELQSDNPLQAMMLAAPVPSDLARQVTGRDVFASISRQQILQDAKYVLRNPLVSSSEFEQDPGKLVGNGKTFFGSNSSSNFANQ